jgi:hypothetical protein
LAIRVAAGCAALVLTGGLAACSGQERPDGLSKSDAQCVKDFNDAAKARMNSMQGELSLDQVDWKIVTNLSEGVITAKLMPHTEPSIRGGGGEYRYSCADKTLELVQGYR